MGKIVNKYIIIEILAFALEDLLQICFHFHSTSKMMRLLLKENQNVLKNMLMKTHFSLEKFINLSNKISSFKIALSAHNLLDILI